MTSRLQPNKSARLWTTDDGLHLDVRGLACPEPLVNVLRVIDGVATGDVIIVHLDQEPLLLYPELDIRGWTHEVVAPSGNDPPREGDVLLMLVRKRA
jgi:TusA-related sulfurtransferase